MPNFDGGHYFLTVLAPIKAELRVDEHGRRRSPAHLIREELAYLRPAEQTVASAGSGGDSPFARVLRTHFARFFVLDDVVYNGRLPSNVLLDGAKNGLRGLLKLKPPPPLTMAQPVDRLPAKYLVFVAAFDAASGAPSELDTYLTALWGEMRGHLTGLFGNCDGFDGVATAGQFCAYIKQCQVETTLPFNDYWTEDPPLKSFAIKPWGIAVGVLALIALIALIAAIAGFYRWPALGIVAGSLIVTAAVIGFAYRALMQAGAAPFPTAPNSDLPSVLKALYLQRTFTTFAIDVQGVDDATLHRKFGEFLARDKPDDLTSSLTTQPAGIIPGIKP
jgi:hypothetical protein